MTTETLKKLLAILCIVLAAVIIFVLGEVIVNKIIATGYDSCSDVDKQMMTMLSERIAEQGATFDTPTLFVREGGVRGPAYLFNLIASEHTATLGLNGGVFGVEILLPSEYELTAPYRMALFAPSLGSLLFSPESGTISVFGVPTQVIVYSEATLADGSFIAAVDAVLTIPEPEVDTETDPEADPETDPETDPEADPETTPEN